MKKVIMGNHAVSYGVRASDVKVISAYPITPQTQIVELLSEMCAKGELDAKFIAVESEHSALTACVGASAAGVRTFTATSSQGLLLMHEIIHWAVGARLPIVLVNVNRAVGPPWSIWTDQNDSLSQRDTGWLQIYCESNQETQDTIVQAFKIAETVMLPVMVVLDAFFLSHTFEIVDILEPEHVRPFLPPYKPEFKIDVNNPHAFGNLASPGEYFELRYMIEQAMVESRTVVRDVDTEFEKHFGRGYGVVKPYRCEDAEIHPRHLRHRRLDRARRHRRDARRGDQDRRPQDQGVQAVPLPGSVRRAFEGEEGRRHRPEHLVRAPRDLLPGSEERPLRADERSDLRLYRGPRRARHDAEGHPRDRRQADQRHKTRARHQLDRGKDMKATAQIPTSELMTSGHLACQGCGATQAMRFALKALGPKTALVIPACCWAVIDGPFPHSSLKVPIFHTAFEAAASTASGVKAGLEMRGDTETVVMAWAGDGGTFDIGIQALSGAAERNEDIIYCCYDNEAYMNTGIQRSSSTPIGAWTTTTPGITGRNARRRR